MTYDFQQKTAAVILADFNEAIARAVEGTLNGNFNPPVLVPRAVPSRIRKMSRRRRKVALNKISFGRIELFFAHPIRSININMTVSKDGVVKYAPAT